MKHEPEFTNRIWKIALGGEDTELQQHIAQCEQCQAELASLTALAQLRDTAGGDLATLSDQQMATLSGMFGKYRTVKSTASETRPSMLQRLQVIMAELLHDTGGQMQVAGLRSGASSNTRQVAFVSDVADLDLEITKTDSTFAVVGQVGMDDVPSGLDVSFVPADQDPLNSDSDQTVTAPVDAQGYFQLQVEGGEWTISLKVDEAVILFPGVTL